MKRPLISAFLSLLLALPAAASGFEAQGDPSVTFLAVGPAGFKINGKGKELSLKDDGKTVTVVVPLKDLDTGIDLRNQHMREKYLEVDKYPNAELTVPWSEIKKPANGEKTSGTAKGTLKLHGKTKEVKFKYAASRKGDQYRVKGMVPVDIRDYEINIPSYLGVTVKPNVDVNVEFGAKEG